MLIIHTWYVMVLVLVFLKFLLISGIVRTFTKSTKDISGIRNITSSDFCNFEMTLNKGTLACVTLNSSLPSMFSQEVKYNLLFECIA